MDNRIAVRLCDTNGHRFYTEEQLGIVICFNKQDWPMVTLIKEYEISKRVVEVKEANYAFRHKGTDLNSIPHLF
jgi:hypothetical protein